MERDIVSTAAALGVATIYEAAGRQGLVDVELQQIVPGTRIVGRARTVLCGQADNLMIHAALDVAEPGEVLVVAMPEPEPVGLVGDLLVTQFIARGLAAVLLADAACRDVEAIRALRFPVWARFIRSRGATKEKIGALSKPIRIGGTLVATGDLVILDADGAVAVPHARVADVLAESQRREAQEERKRERYRAGEISLDVSGMRPLVADLLAESCHGKPRANGAVS